MVDSDPERDARAAQQGGLQKKQSMGADSVLSMARMFQAVRAPQRTPTARLCSLRARVLVYCCDFDLACGRLQGHVPGSSLSDLKEESLRSKQQAYYASFFASERNQSGAKLSATSQANLLARAGRAKGMHRP